MIDLMAAERIENRILLIRGQNVMLDSGLVRSSKSLLSQIVISKRGRGKDRAGLSFSEVFHAN